MALHNQHYKTTFPRLCQPVVYTVLWSISDCASPTTPQGEFNLSERIRVDILTNSHVAEPAQSIQTVNHPETLLDRLSAIGQSLSLRPRARALLGLGSVGQARDRLDAYSDLDFFAVVQAGSKQSFLNDLSWLSDIAPVTYCFQNTPDGFKLLYADGIFCEFAVFEEPEMDTAVYTPGSIVWKAEGVDPAIAIPKVPPPALNDKETDWLIGEALTNLYVGLMRDHRGEHLSAMRFIQSFAVDRAINLFDQSSANTDKGQDPFNPERRLEQRLPELGPLLPDMMQGYLNNRPSALAILSLLNQHFSLPEGMVREIQTLCRPDTASPHFVTD